MEKRSGKRVGDVAQAALLHRTVVPVQGVGQVQVVTVDTPTREPSHEVRSDIGRWSQSRMADTTAVWSGGAFYVGSTSQDVDLGEEGNARWVTLHHASAIVRVPHMVQVYERFHKQGLRKEELAQAVFDELSREEAQQPCLDCHETAENHWCGSTECEGRFAGQITYDDLEA